MHGSQDRNSPIRLKVAFTIGPDGLKKCCRGYRGANPLIGKIPLRGRLGRPLLEQIRYYHTEIGTSGVLSGRHLCGFGVCCGLPGSGETNRYFALIAYTREKPVSVRRRLQAIIQYIVQDERKLGAMLPSQAEGGGPLGVSPICLR